MEKSLAEQLAEVRRGIPAKGEGDFLEVTAAIRGPDLSQYRSLTAEERDFIAFLLGKAESDATAFLPQLEDLQARPSCNCGCPSISLEVAPEQSHVRYPSRMVIDMIGAVGALMVGVHLFQTSGKLSELEVYAFGDITEPFGLPATESLQKFG